MTKYVCVPNQIIRYSCTVNHMILPVYMFSASNCNPYNNDMVITNASLIAEIFAPKADARRQIVPKVIKAMELLSTGVEDCEVLPQLNKQTSKKIKGFSPSIMGCIPENCSKTDIIEYEFIDKKIKIVKDFTMVGFEEYFYFLSAVNEINSEKEKGEKWNLIDLLNFYLYMKMRISISDNSAALKKQQSKDLPRFVMHDSLATLADNLRVGTNTITKYTHQLETIKLLESMDIVRGKTKKIYYDIPDKWLLINSDP